MNQEKIGNFICKLRKESKLTQGKLASKLNVNVKSISRWENGKNLPDHSLIVQICDLFSISINEFYNGSKVNKKSFFIMLFSYKFYNFFTFTMFNYSCTNISFEWYDHTINGISKSSRISI